MNHSWREKASPTGVAPLPSASGTSLLVKRHPHASLVGSPEAETVMFALPRAEAEAELMDRGESASIAAPTPGLTISRPEPRSSPRRTWVSRACLLAILAIQAALSLRLQNTAFEDEALYLYAGHLEVAHLLHGAALQGDFATYFSGAPVLYPVLGAMADSFGGIAAARAVSLVEMLATTAMLYGLSRRLFNERAGLCAAIVFAVAGPIIFLGHFATYDASALFLLALATWIVVRTAAFRWPVYLLAAPVLTLAVATKYASLLFVPCVIAFAGLAAWPARGRKALMPPAALAAAVGGLLGGALLLAGHDYMQGIDVTTLQRSQGTSSAANLLLHCVQWIGLPFGLALIGAVAYTISPYTERGEQIAAAGSRLRRAVLGIVLTGSALLAPAEQIRIHTEVALQKHVGFGLFFAAPIAGVGLTRVIGDHFRRAQLGTLIWATALVLGLTQATDMFGDWTNSTAFVAALKPYLQPGAHYLIEVDEVPIYYLRHYRDAQPGQFTSTFYIGYVNASGQYLTGDAAYVAAIKAGYFRVVSYNYQTTSAIDQVLAHTLEADPAYSLVDAIPNSAGTVTQYVWVRN
jgi:Dolichyl-phosphate-mannose-protein mannosyltransferase